MDVHATRDQLVSVPLARKLKDVKKNVSDVREAAQEVTLASSSRERRSAVARLLGVLFTGEPARIVARLLICSYYINIVYAQLETWQHLRSPEAQSRMRRWQDSTPSPPAFPYAYVVGLLPVAALAAAAVVVPWVFSGLLLVFTVCNDAWITWGHLKNFVMYGGHPSELLVKQLAMMGCAAIMAAASAREEPRLRRVTAGLLQFDSDAHARSPPSGGGPGHQHHHMHASRRRSSVLLLSRLLMGAMLLGLGYHQLLRIKARAEHARFAAASGAPTTSSQHHFGQADAHDTSWLLLECILAIPLALGLCTPLVSRLLCVVLLLEAVTAWQWWLGGWPSWHYRAHVREHYFINAAVAGGLLLMQSFGPGVFTVDSLLMKQD